MTVLVDSSHADPGEVSRFLGLPDPAFFDHEYRRSAQSVFIQARNDVGALVGTQALIPYPLRIGGRTVMTGRSERTMVDPSMRGGGLFPQLMAECAERGAAKGLALIWGTTTAKVPFQRNGFLYFDGFYEHALLCLSPTTIARDLAPPQPPKLRAAKLATALPSLALRAASTLAPRGRSLDIVDRPRQPTDIDALYDDLRGDAPLVVMHHEPAFLTWLLDEGGRRIARYHAYAGDTLAAYAYVDLTAGTTATLLDFAARDAASLRTLVDAIRRDLAPRGVTFLHARYNARNPLLARQRRWLAGCGFVPFYRGGGFVTRALGFSDFNYLGDLSRWYITELWFQLYPQTAS